jgi:hypothetical protein
MTLMITILTCLVLGATLYADARAIGGARNSMLAVSDTRHSDFVPYPPAFRTSTSPDGRYVFEVRSTDGWKTSRAVGRLLKNTEHGARTLWEKDLPQEYGPRYFLVGIEGQVILFDESINVKSRYAIVVFRQPKNLDVIHDFDAVRQALNLSAAAITGSAKSGWWLQGAPTLNAAGTQALAPTGDKFLEVDLNTGRLSVSPRPPPLP